MHEHYVSRLALASAAAWGTVWATMIAAWVVAYAAPQCWLLAAMLGATSCTLSALVVVLSMRRYTIRICRLIRNVHGVPDERPQGLRGLP